MAKGMYIHIINTGSVRLPLHNAQDLQNDDSKDTHDCAKEPHLQAHFALVQLAVTNQLIKSSYNKYKDAKNLYKQACTYTRKACTFTPKNLYAKSRAYRVVWKKNRKLLLIIMQKHSEKVTKVIQCCARQLDEQQIALLTRSNVGLSWHQIHRNIFLKVRTVYMCVLDLVGVHTLSRKINLQWKRLNVVTAVQDCNIYREMLLFSMLAVQDLRSLINAAVMYVYMYVCILENMAA